MLDQLKKEFRKAASPEKARIYTRFFKTGKGEYGEGDQFIGLTVPEQRALARKYVDLPLADVQELLKSRIHEHRLTALIILVYRFDKTKDKKIVDFYLKNIRYSNNWDLIDCVADKILGEYLLDKDRSILYRFVESDSLWERPIAILTTFQFIKNRQFEDTLKIAEILLNDDHDLIHKAVGWMLREVGKRNQAVEEGFLRKHYRKMPRTMLRYAIERFTKEKKRFYMQR